MSTTALDLITGSLVLIGAYSPGESLSAADAQDALRRLNMMMGGWMVQPLTIPVTAREVYPLVAGKGGPGHEYTIGPGGDFNTIRPANGFQNVGLVMGGTTPPLEIPRAIITDDEWAGTAVKDLTNAMFTGLYYNPTFASGWGSINLWPVPNTALHSIALYFAQQISEFANLTTSYTFPPGYEEALEYNLALRLATPFGRQIPQDVAAMAMTSLGLIKRANTRSADLQVDPAFTNDRRGGYNIQTGTGG